MTTTPPHDGDHERLPDDEAEANNQRLLGMLADDMALDYFDLGLEEATQAVSNPSPLEPAPVSATEPAPAPPAADDGPANPVRRARVRPRPRLGNDFKARAGYAARLVGFHLVRLPWYAGHGVKVASVAAFRFVKAGQGRWKLARLAVVASPFVAAYIWSEHGRWGLAPASALAGALVTLVALGYRERRAAAGPAEPDTGAAPVAPGRAPVVVTAAMPEGEPVQGKLRLFGRKDTAPAAPVVSDDDRALVPAVENALSLSGFGALNGTASRVTSAQRVTGGVLLVVVMAPGLETAELIKRHGRFASAMGMAAERLVVEPLPDVSPGAFELFVADHLLSRMPSPPWKWGQVQARSYFEGVPIGVDARGRDVVVPLFETNGGTAGDVGSGKSATARMLLLGAAMDPRTTLIIHNFKGGLDYKPFAPIAHTLRNGCDAADLEAFMGTLKWLRAEVGRRNKILEGLPFEDCPDSKLTDALADRPELRPVFVLLDEVPRVFMTGIADEAEDALLDVVQSARSVGITVRLVFQGAKDGTVPARILDRCKHRIGHAQNSISDANIALGSDAHGRGYRAVDIDTPGVAFVGNAGGSMVKAKLSYLDLPTVNAKVREIEVMRREAGTLTGMAAGNVPEDDDDGSSGVFLDDVVTVWPVDGTVVRTSASLDEVASLLRAHDPDAWGAVSVRDIGAMFRQAGVKVGTVRISSDVAPAKGVKRADVVAAHGRTRGM